jgi:hypothetical protein
MGRSSGLGRGTNQNGTRTGSMNLASCSGVGLWPRGTMMKGTFMMSDKLCSLNVLSMLYQTSALIGNPFPVRQPFI